MSRDIYKFVKPELIEAFLDACKKQGHRVIITSVDRDYKEQRALYAQGRESLEIVNMLRQQAGLAEIRGVENTRKITWTMNSRHIINLDDERLDNDLSYAFDFGLLDREGRYLGDVKADVNANNIADYLECALIGEGLGLKSGRKFKNPDYPHLEL